MPSLVAPGLDQPITESRDILVYLDQLLSADKSGLLTPEEKVQKKHVDKLIDLLHSDDFSTNTLLFLGRDPEELALNRSRGRNKFLDGRQSALKTYSAQVPGNAFYPPRLEMNSSLAQACNAEDPGQDFFKSSHAAHGGFVKSMKKLEELLVLPYAAGDQLTAADLHVAPVFAHALMAVGTEDINDLGPLEAHLQKTDPGFKMGEKTKKWWAKMNQRPSFKEFYPTPH